MTNQANQPAERSQVGRSAVQSLHGTQRVHSRGALERLREGICTQFENLLHY